MTMLAVGRGLRDLAQKGMSAVSRAEAVENQQRLALETAQQQQENATYGTAAGIGGMVGANRMMDASKATSDAIGTFNSAIGKGAGEASTNMLGQVEFTNAVGEVTQGVDAIASMGEVAQGVDSVVQGAEAAQGLAQGAEALKAAETVGTATEAASAVSTAAQASGPMAQLATMATPIAIGLGVAFLLNKLFD
jgi:hypothetical protein